MVSGIETLLLNDKTILAYSKLVGQFVQQHYVQSLKAKMELSDVIRIPEMNDRHQQYFKTFGRINNLEQFLTCKVELNEVSKDEANHLVDLHNIAHEDQVYGERLYTALANLADEDKILPGEVDRIYLYSVSWPSDLKMKQFI